MLYKKLLSPHANFGVFGGIGKRVASSVKNIGARGKRVPLALSNPTANAGLRSASKVARTANTINPFKATSQDAFKQGVTSVVKRNHAIPEYSSLQALRASRTLQSQVPTRAVQSRLGTFKPPTVTGRIAHKKRFGIF